MYSIVLAQLNIYSGLHREQRLFRHFSGMTELHDTSTNPIQPVVAAEADFGRTVVSVYQNTYDTRGITAPLSSVIQRVRSGGFGLKRKTLRARMLATKNRSAYRKFKGRQLPRSRRRACSQGATARDSFPTPAYLCSTTMTSKLRTSRT